MKPFIGVVVLFVLAGSLMGAPIVTAGTHDFALGESKQISILVTGSEVVSGLDLYVQIGDGGAANAGTDVAPKITAIDIVGPGTLFADNNTGQNTTFASDLLWAVSTTTNSGTVTANGIVAKVTIDTAGVALGSYDLRLTGVATGIFGEPGVDSAFSPVSSSIANGIINIIPEPVSLAMLAAGALVLLRRRR